jgi:serine/threonine-protein kinase
MARPPVTPIPDLSAPPRSGSASPRGWQVGSVIGEKYLLQQHLARGGMSDVYRAEHVFTGQAVAVKCLHADLMGRKELLERMRAEAMVTARLKHPNHVLIYDGGVIEGRVYIVMELLEGQDLRHLLVEQGALPLPRALYIACETADALVAAHDIEVTHRDLKPENIFVTLSNVVKVLDFGTAKFRTMGPRITIEGLTPGTLPYMSPEQLAGDEVDGRTDIFAVGVILYELLLGRHPFAIGPCEWPTEGKLRRLMLGWDVPPLPTLRTDVPPYVWQAIEKAIRFDREDRFATMGEFEKALNEARARSLMQPVDPTSGVVAMGSSPATPPFFAEPSSPEGSASQSAPQPSTVAAVPAARRLAAEGVAAPPARATSTPSVRPSGSGASRSQVRRLRRDKVLFLAAICFGATVGIGSALVRWSRGPSHVQAPPALESAVVALPLPATPPPSSVGATVAMPAQSAQPATAPAASASVGAALSATAAAPATASAPLAKKAPRPSDGLVVPDFIQRNGLPKAQPKPPKQDAKRDAPF